MLPLPVMPLALLVFAAADTTDWRAELERGKQAYARQQFDEALAGIRSAEKAARADGNDAALVECLRLMGVVLRESGAAAQAEEMLSNAAEELGRSHGEDSLEVAALQEEIAATNRARGRSAQALEAIEKAVKIRDARAGGPRPELARDLTIAAVLRQQAGQTEPAAELLVRAIREWDTANPGDPQCLPALEALAGIYRDQAKYAEAEPLLERALRQRETAGGPESAEIIATVDSLAYIEFGLKKMPEAEVLYRRLLDLWEKNAGPDHPMVALTLDKMAEFYAFQQRYEDAEKVAWQALEVRTKAHVASLHQTGRILLMEAKLDEAANLYHRTVEIGDLAHASDELLDPSLRVYAKILRELKRDKDAEAVEKRVKDALLRKADREGRRPSPVKTSQ